MNIYLVVCKCVEMSQTIKMEKINNIQDVKVGEQQTEVDPRSKTTADQAFNYIATGKPEMPVGGQKRMLAEKKRNSKAY